MTGLRDAEQINGAAVDKTPLALVRANQDGQSLWRN